MTLTFRPLFAGCLLALAAGLNQGAAVAQYYNPYAYNPYTAYYAQAQYNQQMWNAQAMAQAYRASPGIYQNYYGNPGAMAAPMVSPAAVAASTGSSYSSDPYAASVGNPFTPAAPGYGVAASSYGNNPYNPLNPYNSPGLAYSPGFTLMGEADLVRARGAQFSQIESARLLREQYNQAKLDTRKKQFELEMYIRANTPSYTEKQAQAAKETLKRIQTNSLPGEITNARALNLLLEDLDKYRNKKTSVEPIPIGEMVLTHANVTRKTFGLGILRDEGRLTWPGALQEILTPNERKDLDGRITTLVKGAFKGQGVNADMLKDIRSDMDKLTSDLMKKVNEVPTSQYLDAKRFLQEFHEASVALERGEAENQAKFQRYIEGGKTVQYVVQYMLENGLRFAAATANDEAAYRAIHSALATYDIAVNAGLQFTAKE